jgi:hypothetical protein
LAWSSDGGAAEPVVPARVLIPPPVAAEPRRRPGLLARLFGRR